MYDMDQYAHKYKHQGTHPLQYFVGTSAYTSFLDLMHVVDHKGVAAYVFGSLLWGIMTTKEIAPTYATTLAIINDEIKQFYARNGVQNRMPPITVECIIQDDKTKSYPCFSNPAVKAANTRALLPYFAELAIRLDDGVDVMKRHRRKALDYLHVFVYTLYAAPMFLDDAAKARASNCIDRFVLHYLWLSDNSCRQGRCLWNVTPKFHYLCHISFQLDLITPRFTQNYKEEGSIGRISTLYKSLANGPYLATSQATALRKYVVALHLTLKDLER